MSYSDQLRTEIVEILNALAEEHRPWNPDWITTAICGNHEHGLSEINGEDIEFWRYCGQRACREAVRRCINQLAGDRPEQDDGQLVLPGWDHLQAYYTVNRDGTSIGIPVFDLTDIEIKEKAKEYRKMGEGCFAHADELLRFLSQRAASA